MVFLLPAPGAAQQSETDVYVAQAILAYEARRYDEALALLKEATSQDPNNAEAWYYTGLVYMAQQRLDDAVQALETARSKAPTDFAIRFLLGVAYFSAERYDQAEPLLTDIFNERPETEGVGYYVGLMRYRKKDYQGALRAFRAETSSNPNIRQLARFYAGLTLAILGLPEQAVSEVEAALATQRASPLTGPAERIRDTIAAARQAQQRLQAEVRIGFLYDTNVPTLPAPSHDPVAESIRGHRQSSPGELGSLRLGYTWLRTGPWESSAEYSFFQTYYNELGSFSLQSHLGSAQLTYRGILAAMPFQVGGQYTFEYFTLGGDEYLQRQTFGLFGTVVENANNVSTLVARWQVKNFAEDQSVPFLQSVEGRDGNNWMVGLVHALRFQGDRYIVRGGYQFDWDDTFGQNWQYTGSRLLAGVAYALPWVSPWGPTRLSYDLDVHFRNYLHAHTLLPDSSLGGKKRRRLDTEQNHIFRVVQPLPHNLSLVAEFQLTANASNLAVYAYNRSVFDVYLSWQY
ncbi:MAG TPA: tetratricopeptide repeat protein [Methylomirabilota bacterium]|nr:tetratricopeptide repeat protein [Methylomirabilota bacterium]